MTRMTAMLRTAMALMLGFTAAALWAAGEAAAEERVMTRQKNSHDAAFFQSLLSGRVWVNRSVLDNHREYPFPD